MKQIYYDNEDDVTPEDFETIRSGDYIAKPKRGMMFDAHDQVIERHYKEASMRVLNVRKIDMAGKIMMSVVVLLVAIAAGWFLLNDPMVVTKVADPAETPVVLELTTLDGSVFICEHYRNGTQICVSQDDPDVGGGRIVP